MVRLNKIGCINMRRMKKISAFGIMMAVVKIDFGLEVYIAAKKLLNMCNFSVYIKKLPASVKEDTAKRNRRLKTEK